ncbi:MAG: toast rack family protein [Egibacteraceae bacterium]
MRHPRLLGPLVLSSLLGLVAACSDGVNGAGSVNSDASENVQAAAGVQTEQRVVERMGASSAVVAVAMGAGELEVSGGASGDQLLDATFVFSEPEWRPEVDYQVDGTEGRLEIRQGDTDRIETDRIRSLVNARNEWTLRLRPELGLRLRVDMGAGRSQLDLRGLDLTTLEVSKGAGQTEIDLSGDWRRDVAVTIEGGAGQLSLTLPQSIGVRVEVDTGMGVVNARGFQRDGGAYVNEAFGESPVTMTVTAELGAGVLDLSLV